MEKDIYLITGSSSGIGQALAKELLSQGEFVIGISRSPQENLGENFMPVVCDVSLPEGVSKLFEILKSKNLLPKVFFLNAGIAGEEVIEHDGFDLEKHKKIMDVNYFGVLYFIKEWMEARSFQTHFIVTSSVNALWAPPKGSAYAASKAAISKAFEGLSVTFIHTKSRFSSLYLGPVQTKGLAGRFPFTWTPLKMAKYMIDFSKGKRKRVYPSLFYFVLCFILKNLPHRLISKMFTDCKKQTSR